MLKSTQSLSKTPIRLCLLALTLTLAGCTSMALEEVDMLGSSASGECQLSYGTLDSAKIAVGGVIWGRDMRWDIHSGLEDPPTRTDFLSQCDMWSIDLTLPLMEYPELEQVIPWKTVRDLVPEPDMRKIHALFANMAVLNSRRLAPVKTAIPHADYLVLARMDLTRLEGRSLSQASGLHGSIGRSIYTTLELYDLQSGTSVWRKTKRMHWGRESEGIRESSDSHVMVNRMADGNVDLGMEGITSVAPDLESMLRQALKNHVSAMMTETHKLPDVEPFD